MEVGDAGGTGRRTASDDARWYRQGWIVRIHGREDDDRDGIEGRRRDEHGRVESGCAARDADEEAGGADRLGAAVRADFDDARSRAAAYDSRCAREDRKDG
jgi:hypothetical protein